MNDRQLAVILERHCQRHGGRLRPDDLVNEARDPSHPLHDQFTWDDAEAAHRHRLDQARALIRRVPVYTMVTPERTVRVPVYVHDPRSFAHVQGYTALDMMERSSAQACDVLGDELSRVAGNLRRATGIAARVGFAGLAETLTTLLAGVERAEMEVANYRPPAQAG